MGGKGGKEGGGGAGGAAGREGARADAQQSKNSAQRVMGRRRRRGEGPPTLGPPKKTGCGGEAKPQWRATPAKTGLKPEREKLTLESIM